MAGRTSGVSESRGEPVFLAEGVFSVGEVCFLFFFFFGVGDLWGLFFAPVFDDADFPGVGLLRGVGVGVDSPLFLVAFDFGFVDLGLALGLGVGVADRARRAVEDSCCVRFSWSLIWA